MTLPFPLFTDQTVRESEPGRWDELHLYSGARCNRACAFCCVSGDPKGAYAPWTEETLQAAARLVARRGSLKFYGGEPTLDPENLLWAIKRLRSLGYEGAFVLFSNGIRARALLRLLQADDNMLAVLNYSIATGRGEKPLPPASLRCLQEYAVACPNRLFLSHDFILPVGRQEREGEAQEPIVPEHCFRCFPTLTSDGRLHACPFAVEYDRPHYRLGDTRTPSDIALQRFHRFLDWISITLEPQAAAQGWSACEVCTGSTAPAFSSQTPALLSVTAV